MTSIYNHGPSGLWQRDDIQAVYTLYQKRLGANLLALRRERGLTQEQVAERAGLHPKHVQRIEATATNPTLATLTACATALDVPLEQLLAESVKTGRAR